MLIKDSRSKKGYRNRIIHNVKFTFTGNTEFITELQNYLVNKLNLSKTKLNFSKAKIRNTDTFCTVEYSGRKNIEKLFKFMYSDAKIYGNRKYQKFKEIICALNEKSLSEMGLIAGTPEMVISSQVVNTEGSSTIPEMEVESSDSKCPTLTE